MKLLKIGSSPSCNIVINSPYVSGVHAEMTILDNGEIFIEDKNSTNGTFVGGQRLTPNVETPVRRGDLVQFGNVQLQWHQVPVLDNPSKYKTILNIGTSHRCDINIDSQFASRYHATMFVDKKGKCFLQDNESKNGTEVNGSKIAKGKKIAIKHGDQIVVADVDVTDQLKPHIPNPFGWIKTAVIAIVAAAALCGIGFGIWNILNKTKAPSLDVIQTGVVQVMGTYCVYAEMTDNPIQDEIWKQVAGEGAKPGCLKVAENVSYVGTAFFLDRDGRLGTNRHVAVPWEYVSDGVRKEWHNLAVKKFNDDLPSENLSAEIVAVYNALGSELWQMVLMQTEMLGNGRASYASSLIRQLKNVKFKLVGELENFAIGYPGRMYDNFNELSRCSLLEYSETPDIDLAIIQVNDLQTPPTVKWVFDPSNFQMEKPKPQAEHLTWIGYPAGLQWSNDKKATKLRPQVCETMCSATPSKYDFDIQGEVRGGASGSPLFSPKTGQLVGVVYYTLGGTYGRAVQAKYLKEMYDEATK